MSVYLPNIQITYATSSLTTYKSFNTPIIIGSIDAFDSFQSLIDFSQLDLLIIDEIDTMIIRDDYRQTLLNLIDSFPLINHCQTLAYSSTLSEQIMNFTNELVPDSIVIKQRSDKQQIFNIEQFYVKCEDENMKFDTINVILKRFTSGQIMIFCSTDEKTEQLYQKMIIDNRNEYVINHLQCCEHLFRYFSERRSLILSRTMITKT
jgi:ATP-dependent RNA helicase DDX19/DBP5